MRSKRMQIDSGETESLIFNAAFADGNEKLYEVCTDTGNVVSYLLRKNTFVCDNNGNELWNEAQQSFPNLRAYLDTVSSQLATYVPMELNFGYADVFKERLLQSVRATGIDGERKMFSLGNGFSNWSRWMKLLGGGVPNEQPDEIVVHSFIAKEPIRKIQIEKAAIRSFQDMLNRIYSAMLTTTFRVGQYGKTWTLYNLSNAAIIENVNRNSVPDFATGNEFAILRLNPG